MTSRKKEYSPANPPTSSAPTGLDTLEWRFSGEGLIKQPNTNAKKSLTMCTKHEKQWNQMA